MEVKKKYILTKNQLNEFIESKINNKLFFDIIEKFNFINENVNNKLNKSTKQTILDDLFNKNIINESVRNELIKYSIIDFDNKIL
jgi:hypothetical protein